MSNLSNQYISSSYSALLNLAGAGAVLTSTPSVIQDGTGQSSPLQLSTSEVVINGTLTMSGSIIPATSGSYDIGSSAKPFRHIYASSGSIYLDDHQILSLQDNGGNTAMYAPPGGNISFNNDVNVDANGVNGSNLTLFGGDAREAHIGFSNTDTAFIQQEGTLALVVNQPEGVASGSMFMIAQNGGSIQLEAVGRDGTGSVNLIARSGSVNIETNNDGNIILQTYSSGSIGINSQVSVQVTSPTSSFEGGIVRITGDQYILGNGSLLLQGNVEGSGSINGGVYTTLDTTSGTTTSMFSGIGIGSDLNNGFFGSAYSTYQNAANSVEAAFYGPGTGNNDGGGGVDDVIFKLDATVPQGTPNPVKWYRDTNWTGYLNITGSLSIDSGSINVPSLLNFTDASDPGVQPIYISGSEYQLTIVTPNFDLTTEQLSLVGSPQYPLVQTAVSSSIVGDGIFNAHLANYDGESIGFGWSTYNSIPENSLSAVFYGPGIGNNPSPYGGTDNVVFAFQTGSNVVDWYRDTVWNGTLSTTQGFAQQQLITTQTIGSGTDTVITFNHTDFDPSGWYNSEYFYYQPTVAGTYQVSYGVNFEDAGSGTGQINVQIRQNETGSVNINQSNLNVGYNQTLTGTYFVQMNGTTDILDLSAYSSVGQDILASNGTFINIKLI